jgi:hypothetical protein
MFITPKHYWMGRDETHAAELTPEIRANGEELVRRISLLLGFAEADGVTPGYDQVTGTHIAGGWRPRGVNARTANAGKNSTHITGQGVDVQDTPSRDLARWCLANLDALETCGLYMERPQWTAGANNDDPWCHFQSVPPKSGKRVYIPSNAPAQAAALPGEVEAA